MKASLEKIKSTIAYIIKSQPYPDVMFSNVTHGVVVIDDELLHYRLSGIHTEQCKIEVVRNDNVVYDRRKQRKRCKFCRKKHCNAVLQCCGARCHFDCIRGRGYHCDCDGYIEGKVPLTEAETEDTCIVCLDEDCTTQTRCGHCVCRTCIGEIYRRRGKLAMCPMCREPLLDTPVADELKVNIDVGQIANKQINVKILFYDK